jgi:hypothetical protein
MYHFLKIVFLLICQLQWDIIACIRRGAARLYASNTFQHGCQISAQVSSRQIIRTSTFHQQLCRRLTCSGYLFLAQQRSRLGYQLGIGVMFG